MSRQTRGGSPMVVWFSRGPRLPWRRGRLLVMRVVRRRWVPHRGGVPGVTGGALVPRNRAYVAQARATGPRSLARAGALLPPVRGPAAWRGGPPLRFRLRLLLPLPSFLRLARLLPLLRRLLLWLL